MLPCEEPGACGGDFAGLCSQKSDAICKGGVIEEAVVPSRDQKRENRDGDRLYLVYD